jgi:hypothetical protein
MSLDNNLTTCFSKSVKNYFIKEIKIKFENEFKHVFQNPRRNRIKQQRQCDGRNLANDQYNTNQTSSLATYYTMALIIKNNVANLSFQ